MMLELLMCSIFFISMFFVIVNNPLILMVYLIFSTILISFMMFFISLLSWFSYILILVYLGGMLILFVYISNLASNEIFSTMNYYFFVLLFFLPFLLKNELDFSYMSVKTMNELFMNMNISQIYSMKLSFTFTMNNSFMVFTLITLLFFLLFIVMKLINIYEGPLRQK